MITTQQVQHIAHLAKLQLGDDEIKKYQKELSDILGYVSQINEVDVAGIDDEHNLSEYTREVLQEDEVRAFEDTKALLANTTHGRSKNGFVRTSKIVHKE